MSNVRALALVGETTSAAAEIIDAGQTGRRP
jgi:hypothetical protein